MDLSQLISEVARAKNDLAELQWNENLSAERLVPCIVAARNLEEATSELFTTAWVPRDPAQLLAAIQCANKNLRSVQADVAAALDVVLLECRPDELYRAFIALSFARLLEFERDILCDALLNGMKCPCGCGAFVPSGWIN